MRSDDSRLQQVQRFEEMKIPKGLKSVLKDAVNYAKDLGITITFDNTKTVLINEDQKNHRSPAGKSKPRLRLPHSSKKQHLHEGDNRTEMAWSVLDSTKRRQRNGYWRVQVTTKLEKRIQCE